MTCNQNIEGSFICDDLTDVWEMIRNPIEGMNYTGFETPTPQDLERIQPGNVVKISRDINKIFVEITENQPCYFTLIGKIVQGDLEDQPFQEGDILIFLYRNVYSINEDLGYI
jgi:hypothetical protein